MRRDREVFKKGIIALIFLIFLLFGQRISFADHARVLPKNLWRFRIYAIHGFATQAFNSAGRYDALMVSEVRNWWEDIEFIFPIGHKIGTLKNNAHLYIDRTDFLVDYGITDTITFQAWIPYYALKAIDIRKWTYLDNENDDATSEWLDEAFNDLSLWKANLLYPKDLTNYGLGDILIGYKHQIFKSKTQRFAYATGFRLPTGKVDDPNDLTDTSLGDGQMDIGIWFFYDFLISDHFFFNVHTRHEYGLKGKYDKPSDPMVAQLVDDDDPGGTYHWQPGFYNYIELEPQWTYHNGRVSPSFLVQAFYKTKDNYTNWTVGGGDKWKERNTQQGLLNIGPKFYYYRLRNADGTMSSLPFELSAEIRFPILGQNVPATILFLFEAKMYAKFW